MIPTEFKQFFWDTEFEKLDINLNKEYIISRIFSEGNWDAVKWLKKTYTEEEIKDVVKSTRRLNPISANFLKNVYQLKEEEMMYYINEKNSHYEYKG